MPNGKSLRALLNDDAPVLMPGVYDCVSARLVEEAGFKAAFISGGAVTASVLGYPDVGLQCMTEILGQVRNIANVVNIPVLVDIDNGYGNVLNIIRTIKEFEKAGAGGVFFEDQTFPKRCGHFEGKQMISTEEMASKVKAACDARVSSDMIIVARTDVRTEFGLDCAIDRANAYVEAGADAVYIEALQSAEEFKKAGAAIPAPLQANMSEGNSRTPVLHYSELYEYGCKLISYSGLVQRAAIQNIKRVLKILVEEGSAKSAYPDLLCNVVERSKLLNLEDFYSLEEKYGRKIQESDKSWRVELSKSR